MEPAPQMGPGDLCAEATGDIAGPSYLGHANQG